jgi:hypothetical protein
MKKLLVALIVLIVALSLTGVAFAQAKAKPAKPAEAAKPEVAKKEAPPVPAKPAEAAKPEVAKKEAPAKPVVFRMGGEVTAVNAAAKTITIKQDAVKKHKKVVLSVSKKAAKDLSGVSVGDVVNVWVSGKAVTTLTKVF